MLLTEFDYEKIMRSHYGNKQLALNSMVKSFAMYYPKRNNFIARKRVMSCIFIIRKLKRGIKNDH